MDRSKNIESVLLNDKQLNEVIILKVGYSTFYDSGSACRAGCTATLVKTSDNENILVDTLGPWERDELIECLADKGGIQPHDVTIVIGTHHHIDHIGNLNLFTGTKMMIAGQDQIKGDQYCSIFPENASLTVPYHIANGVKLWSTPGHTYDCVSLIVEKVKNYEMGIVAIVGDLFENKSDLNREHIWIEAGSVDVEEQRKSRQFILSKAEYIIPGHGDIFKISEAIADVDDDEDDGDEDEEEDEDDVNRKIQYISRS